MSKNHLNYLRRKTADEAELWAADRIEQLEAERDELKALLKEAFSAGAASRDAEIAELIGMREEVLHYQREFHRKNDEIAELVAALKPFGAIDLVESRVPAEFAMLVLRASAAIAKARKP